MPAGLKGHSIIFQNGMFIIVGDTGYYSTSIDGETWSNPIRLKYDDGSECNKKLLDIITIQ